MVLRDIIVNGLREAGYEGAYQDMLLQYLRDKSGLTEGALNDLLVKTYEVATVNEALEELIEDAEDGFSLAPTDPFFANVKFLANFTTDASDITGTPTFLFGDAHVAGGALVLDGAGDYLDATPLVVPATTGEAETFEGYFTFNTLTNGATQTLFTLGGGNQAGRHLFYQLNGFDSSFGLDIFGVGSVNFTFGPGAFSAGVPFHVAFCRSATDDWTAFLNGVQGIGVLNSTFGSPIQPFLDLGQFVGIGFSLNGNISSFRYTKGIARYTANFTPPTEPFPEA